MKKTFHIYATAWALLLAIFNVLAFIIPNRHTASFWIGYIFISLSFIGQLVYSYRVFKDDKIKKVFYNFSLIRINYIALFAAFIAGGLCMVISPIPYWIGGAACVVVLVIHILSCLKATIAIVEVERIDKKTNSQTAFIKSLTLDADTLTARAKSDAVKSECRKVYEAIRFSDPMSHDELAPLESTITVEFLKFAEAVKADAVESVIEIANEFLRLLSERNKKCKLLK